MFGLEVDDRMQRHGVEGEVVPLFGLKNWNEI